MQVGIPDHSYSYAKDFDNEKWYYFNCYPRWGPENNERSAMGISSAPGDNSSEFGTVQEIDVKHIKKIASQEFEREKVSLLFYQRVGSKKTALEKKVKALSESLRKFQKTLSGLQQTLGDVQKKLAK